MTVFIGNRLVLMVVTVLVSSFVVFGVMEFSPGNVASKTLGPYASDESKEFLFNKLNLDDPLLVRYGRWIGVLSGIIEDPLGDPELDQKEKDLREESFRLRLRMAAGQTENKMARRAARRDLARVLTIKAERKASSEG